MYELDIQFRGASAPAPFDQIVIHESVTHDKDRTIAVLKARKLSVHFAIDQAGYVSQLMSLTQYGQHAGPLHNKRSIAIEIINPYYGRGEGISGVWVDRSSRDGSKTYLVPPLPQLEMAFQLIRALTNVTEIPLDFPGYREGAFRWGRDELAASKPGVIAHHRSNHADGLFIEHYCLSRTIGLEPEKALEVTLAAAQSGKRETYNLEQFRGEA